MTYDIGASNERQSNFLQGYGDAEDRRPACKPDNDDYMRGYRAGTRCHASGMENACEQDEGA